MPGGVPMGNELVEASAGGIKATGASPELPAVIGGQAGREIIPAMVADAGDAACFVWEEFFTGEIRNPHTRRAYRHAVRKFLAWVAAEGFGLRQITPGLVGRYLDQAGGSIPT